MAKCCNIDTRGNIKSPIPKSSAISIGPEVVLELVVSKLNFHGNCHDGKPSSTSPVTVKASIKWYSKMINKKFEKNIFSYVLFTIWGHP